MNWELIVTAGLREGTVVPLTRLPFRIGRGSACHLRPHDPAVSRHHCTITERDGQLVIEDVGSRAGTFVNGVRVTAAATLVQDDEVRVGCLRLRVGCTAEEVEHRPETPEEVFGRMLLEI